MDRKELSLLLNVELSKAGCTKGLKDSWYFESNENVYIFELQSSSWSKFFYLNVGIYFKQFDENKKSKKLKVSDCHLSHSLFNVLLHMGFPSSYLNKLFSFEHQVEAIHMNMKELIDILVSQVQPFLKKFEDFCYLKDNFEKEIAYKIFYVYFFSIEKYIQFFSSKCEFN